MKAICFLSGALFLLGAQGCGHVGTGASGEKAADQEQEGGVPVRTTPAQLRELVDAVHGLGRCEALPGRAAVLTAAVEGRVAQLPIQPGNLVTAGQAIVQLDPTVAQANLDEKKATRDSQEASLRLLESLPRIEEQQSAKLAIEQARVAVEKARLAVDRLRPLRARGEVSEAVFYEAESSLRQADLQLKTAESQYQVLMLRPRPEAIKEAETRVAAADAASRAAQAQRDLHVIATPIDGVLDSLTCSLGQTLSAGAAVGQVVDAKQLHVVAWLSAPDARRVRPGQTAEVRRIGSKEVADRAPSSEPVLEGRVVFVGSVIDPQTGNLPVRILVDNAEGRFKLGQTVSARIAVDRRKVLAVPAEAVNDLGEGPLLSVVRNRQSAILYPQLGLKDRGWVEVLGIDLAPGEPVIVEGAYNLPDETPVTEQPAEAKP
ncbi:MAG: efflux RND transporter periplasmic adaptor subunit [Thermoguttaceae bacterium]